MCPQWVLRMSLKWVVKTKFKVFNSGCGCPHGWLRLSSELVVLSLNVVVNPGCSGCSCSPAAALLPLPCFFRCRAAAAAVLPRVRADLLPCYPAALLLRLLLCLLLFFLLALCCCFCFFAAASRWLMLLLLFCCCCFFPTVFCCGARYSVTGAGATCAFTVSGVAGATGHCKRRSGRGVGRSVAEKMVCV